MKKKSIMPQVEVEEAKTGTGRGRYVAYMQCIRKLELKAKAEKESREKAARMGGAAV